MKIAYLADEIPNLRGSTRYQRARHLSQKNELFLFLRKDSPVPEEIQAKVTIARSGFTSVPLHLLWRLYMTWKMGKKVHFDFVYTFHSPFSTIGGFLLRLLGFKWIADFWDHPEQILEAERKGSWRRLATKAAVILARRFLRYADLIICGVMTEALQAYNIDPRRILPVTNGVELDYVKPGEGKKNSSEEFQVFYVGPLRWVRSIDTLLEAVSKVHSELPVKLTLAGRIHDDIKTWLNNFISKHDLGDTVEILGEIEQDKVFSLMEESDVCVCPLANTRARRCAYPIKVLQYLAMGKPVVATNLPGVAQFIKHGENGLLVNPHDSEEMARALLRIYEDAELREKLEQNARKSILEYDWSIINEKIDNALSGVKEGRYSATS